jgi:trans-aconitate methyltransferase
MGQQQPKEYYDNLWSGEYYKRAASELTHWFPVWEAVAKLAVRGPEMVVDLGCGPGHLAERLIEHGLSGRYVGYDFSSVAIEEAKKRIVNDRFTFACVDLCSFDFVPQERACYVATEFFEHVEFDLEILGRIPEHSRVIFSVPSFDDPGHVRHHPTVESIWDRYSDAVSIYGVRTMLGGHRYVVDGVKAANPK